MALMELQFRFGDESGSPIISRLSPKRDRSSKGLELTTLAGLVKIKLKPATFPYVKQHLPSLYSTPSLPLQQQNRPPTLYLGAHERVDRKKR